MCEKGLFKVIIPQCGFNITQETNGRLFLVYANETISNSPNGRAQSAVLFAG